MSNFKNEDNLRDSTLEKLLNGEENDLLENDVNKKTELTTD